MPPKRYKVYTCICMYVCMYILYIDTYLFVCGLNIIVAIVYNKNVGPAETCNTFYALRLNTSSSLSTSPSRLFSANVLLLVRLQRRRMANDLYHTYKQTHTNTHTQRDKHTRAYIRCSRFLYGGLLLLLFSPPSPLPPLSNNSTSTRSTLTSTSTARSGDSDVFSFCLLCVTPLRSLSNTQTHTHRHARPLSNKHTQRDKDKQSDTHT